MQEDGRILGGLWTLPMLQSSSYPEFVSTLKGEIRRLRGRGSPPSHIFISSHNWRFVQALRHEDAFLPPTEKTSPWLLGRWDGIAMYNLPGRRSLDRMVVTCLGRTLRLHSWTRDVNYGRFRTMFRELTPDEGAASNLSSECGIPFEGEDLTTASKCRVLFTVEEALDAEVVDQCASSALKIPVDTQF